MKIWQKYLLGSLIKTFLFLIFCLFTLYVIVDLSVHGMRFFSQGKSTFVEVSIYYLHTFSTLLELFLILTFLFSIMKVLFDLNTHRELVALQMAGLSKKRLLTPFFIFATLLSVICYINSEWVVPHAQATADAFRYMSKKKKSKGEETHVHSVSLADDSELVYQSFDFAKKELFDVFWVRTPEDIWHMKYLQIQGPLCGRFVNHLIRNSKNQFEKSESFPTRYFPELLLDDEAPLLKFVPFENRSLLTLLSQAFVESSERSSVFSHLYYKLAIPLMFFLVLISVCPISLRFSRNQPFFLIAAFSLLGFITLKVILDGMLILGENQVFPALIAIWGPIAFAFSLSIPSFVRMR